MCACTPERRTPFCGRPGCAMPSQKPALTRDGLAILGGDRTFALELAKRFAGGTPGSGLELSCSEAHRLMAMLHACGFFAMAPSGLEASRCDAGADIPGGGAA